jgi:hypothetical protein
LQERFQVLAFAETFVSQHLSFEQGEAKFTAFGE